MTNRTEGETPDNGAGRELRDIGQRRVDAKTAGRFVVVCVVLMASFGVRWLQAHRIGRSLVSARVSPFHLAELPLAINEWRGEETQLDPEIARNTGSSDSIFRRYVNQKTGVSLDMIVLYGANADMFIHLPEVCYPKAGYAQQGSADQRLIHSTSETIPFRSLVYTKGEGGATERQEVFYSWRFQGKWSTAIGTQKQLERIPGMFKVQLARRILASERRDIGNPCEAFLESLIPEIEQRLNPITNQPSINPQAN